MKKTIAVTLALLMAGNMAFAGSDNTLSKEEKAAFEKLRGSSNLSPKPAKTDKNFFDRLKKMFS